MTFIDVHLEKMNDNGEKLQRILDEGIPVGISIAPYSLREGWYSQPQVELVHSILTRVPGAILGQQGDTHKCRYKHRLTDKYHENACPYHDKSGVGDVRFLQAQFMQHGAATLLDFFGISPKLYCPPNHLFDKNTLEIAREMGYQYMAIRGDPMIESGGILIWEDEEARNRYQMQTNHISNQVPRKGTGVYGPAGSTPMWDVVRELKVIPETKMGERGMWKYIHYDQIDALGFDEVFNIGTMGIEDEVWRSNEVFGLNAQSTIEKLGNRTIRNKILRDIMQLPARLMGRIK